MKMFKVVSTFICAGVLLSSCGEKKKEVKEVAESEVMEVAVAKEVAPNIVEVAASNDAFTTLVAAVKAADLVATLSSDGPFTVFAPTNDAFAKLPEGTVNTLLKPENVDTLTGILTYHVVAGKFEATAVIEAITSNNGSFTVTTVQGNDIMLSLEGDKVLLTDATGATAFVVIPDVAASNGVIHAIDSVVMPE